MHDINESPHSDRSIMCVLQCTCGHCARTSRAGDGDNPSSRVSQQGQEALGDAQCSKVVDLHAAAIVGHQRKLSVAKVRTHACVIHQSPKT